MLSKKVTMKKERDFEIPQKQTPHLGYTSGINPYVEDVSKYSRKDDKRSLEPLCFDFEMH